MHPYCDKAFVMTVGLPLVDANAENGCLWVLPRQHTGDVLRHQNDRFQTYLEIPAEELPPVESVCVPVKKGSVLLMTNLTPHVSFENAMETVRWSMDLRYQSASLPTNAQITRLKGETLPDAALGVPMACYPPEADFLVRSHKRPAEVVTDAARFHQIRNEHPTSHMTGTDDLKGRANRVVANEQKMGTLHVQALKAFKDNIAHAFHMLRTEHIAPNDFRVRCASCHDYEFTSSVLLLCDLPNTVPRVSRRQMLFVQCEVQECNAHFIGGLLATSH